MVRRSLSPVKCHRALFAIDRQTGNCYYYQHYDRELPSPDLHHEKKKEEQLVCMKDMYDTWSIHHTYMGRPLSPVIDSGVILLSVAYGGLAQAQGCLAHLRST